MPPSKLIRERERKAQWMEVNKRWLKKVAIWNRNDLDCHPEHLGRIT
jgi:hypothetical protein